MKVTGLVRRIDSVGRFFIPAELKDIMKIKPHDRVEILFDDEYIILTKYYNKCLFCGTSSDLFVFKRKYVCENCKHNILLLNSIG